jgi:ubiquinone/menaquinone biosynthesis C-methylase UbiE
LTKKTPQSPSPPAGQPVAAKIDRDLPLPGYLRELYWWAYIHPNAVRLFERQWLVNLILWGHFRPLRDAVFAEFGPRIRGRSLQVACVYGDFTQRLAALRDPGSRLDLVDVAPIQLRNAERKMAGADNVFLHHQNAARLGFADETFDQVVVFFLLHEQPESVRSATIRESLRVTRPGGKVVFVDYHQPVRGNPLRYLMSPLLKRLEPFALDLWRREIIDWVPAALQPRRHSKELRCGGLYQKVVMTR